MIYSREVEELNILVYFFFVEIYLTYNLMHNFFHYVALPDDFLCGVGHGTVGIGVEVAHHAVHLQHLVDVPGDDAGQRRSIL